MYLQTLHINNGKVLPYMGVSIIGPGWDKACFRSWTAVTSFLYGPRGRPKDFMSLSVSSMRASRSICSSLNFCTYWERPHAVRNRSSDAYADSSVSPSSSDVIVELSGNKKIIIELMSKGVEKPPATPPTR